MRRATVVVAGAALALAAVAVSSSESATALEGREERVRERARERAPQPMPDFLGKGLWRVLTALDPRTRLDVHDVGGGDRRVLWPPNWRVCTQHPAPGTARGPRRRVVVGVVKNHEPCPARVLAARR
ncbi:hypothetical protein ACIGO8_08990 [Streptomyces sp. NPDC053493]|uniref:hypothetical protein n=1 Tax=Streptomyces sp. NPDC053493 TaxID=3365705 RepID=UPI0037CE6FDA